ncbi:MAG TPA: PilZ domain-containing protein [Candidatus Goldiibacteriota bacterium]|nr:PilZ domain-containing protein [Candidatus Goldiibacteriota bacterium]
MMVNTAERRKAPRINADFPVKYRILKAQNIDSADWNTYREIKADNISEFGIALLAKEPLAEGDIIQANFYIEGREIDAFCTVVWSDYVKEKEGFETGLEFDFIGQYDAIYLVQYIKKRLEE